MRLRFGLLLVLATMWSCSGKDEQKVAEPVAAEPEQKVPDAPGSDSGEAAAKPAGEGSAATIGHSPSPPEVEKSQPDPQAAHAASVKEGDWLVRSRQLHVRKGPGKQHAVVRTLQKGAAVRVAECSQGWCKLADNEFVAQKYLKTAK